MDKVQFNTQVVNMRKTVKRSKVQLIHRLTRQIMVIRKRKGCEKQIAKNERRAERLIKEIEVIKDLSADEVTMSAIIIKKSLQAVLDNPNSSAVERGTARLIHHRLITQQVATFKDLVTDDLLEIGKRKEKLFSRMEDRKIRKSRRESESSNEEEPNDYSGDESSSKASHDDMKTPLIATSQQSLSMSLSYQNKPLEEEMQGKHHKSGFFRRPLYKQDDKVCAEEKEKLVTFEGDDDDGDDDDDALGENFNAEFRELSAELKKEGTHSSGQVEKERKKCKGVDSLFVGKLSGKSMHPDNNQGRGKKNRPGQKERQMINMKKQLRVLRRPADKQKVEGSRHIAQVDLPCLDVKEKGRVKLIAGINAPIKKTQIVGSSESTQKTMPADPSSKKALSSQRPLPVPKRGRGRGRQVVQCHSQAQDILHPSWIAKKKKKEQESKILPFAGTKITFDE